MDRNLYKSSFTEQNPIKWMCPKCQKAPIKIKEKTLNFDLTSQSRENLDLLMKEELRFVYTCIFKCRTCSEIVTSNGYGRTIEVLDPKVDDLESYQKNNGLMDQMTFFPKYFYPHLSIFDIPVKTPNSVKKEINQSFELFFCNPSSSGNHLRIALEHLLTHFKIPKNRNNKGKREPIFLGSRINTVVQNPKKHIKLDEVIDEIKAIKWLGNTASHSGKQLTKSDILDGYEMMEHVLHELFDNKKEHIKKLAKKINENSSCNLSYNFSSRIIHFL